MNKLSIKDKYGPLLKDAGLKSTPERFAIINALTNSKKPLSVKELKERLASEAIDQATIYRTLQSLTQNNIVRTVNFQHDHNHYELVSEIHHHHLICQSCGKVVDVSKCDTSNIENEVKKLGNFAKINYHALEFFGICKTCKK